MNTETKPFLDYIHALEKELAAGNATEHTHRPAMKTLLETVAQASPWSRKVQGQALPVSPQMEVLHLPRSCF